MGPSQCVDARARQYAGDELAIRDRAAVVVSSLRTISQPVRRTVDIHRKTTGGILDKVELVFLVVLHTSKHAIVDSQL